MWNKTLVILALLLLTAPQVAAAKKCKLNAVEHSVPQYPAVAASASVSGVVYVVVTLNEAGTVTDARVRSGHKLLNDAALEAAKRWKFAPCERPQSTELIFKFEIAKPDDGARLEPPYSVRAPLTVTVKAPHPRDNVQ